MNQGGNASSESWQNPAPVEASQTTNPIHGYASYYPPNSGYDSAAWATQTSGNVNPQQNYSYAQPTESQTMNVLDASNAASHDPSSTGTTIPLEYSCYPPHQSSTDPHVYSNTAQQGYFNYQQQPSHSYSQTVGAYANSGAPYQPISSFQNTGSYAEPASYSNAYYSPGGYQTSSGGYQNQTAAGGYATSSYSNQTNMWNGGAHANYTSQQPTYYASDPNSALNSTSAGTSGATQYQQQYNHQWTDNYNQTEVSCAPGTEHIPKTATPNMGYAVPGVSSAYSATSTQQLQPVIPTRRPEPIPTELTVPQPSGVGNGAQDNYGQHVMPGSQNQHVRHQIDYQNYSDPNASYNSFQDSQKTGSTLGANSQYNFPQQAPPNYQLQAPPNYQQQAPPNYQQQAPPNYQQQAPPSYQQQVPPNYQPPSQIVPTMEPRPVSNRQIQTKPKIDLSLPFGTPKLHKDRPEPVATAKPAYLSVAPKPNDKNITANAADSTLKSGYFPKSMCGYVERALARCKDGEQMAACEAIAKEVIRKATADGTLYTRDWDTEPLFSIPSTSLMDSEFDVQKKIAFPSQRRSPTRRLKSRWEPIQEEKPIEKPLPASNGTFKFGGWVPSSEKDKKFPSKLETRQDDRSSSKFIYEPKSARKNGQMQFKRQRIDETVGGANNSDASSDSDKEQSLTAFYSGAITLANTPEEKQRRESRSKRFEGLRHHGESNQPRLRPSAGGHVYTKRASSLVISKNYEESGSTAVEDIDWDALTVKGTCQEIEKKYLRLTCAPDPATVRPEDILDKALSMVQNSPKNYLYKCDQLKSIRQDLTVQRIRNQLTVKVYETHARLALEVGDLPEYNQCQSQLKTLYAEGIQGCDMEFSAYNLLCVMLNSSNTRDLVSSMSRLSIEAKNDNAVKHALAVRSAVTSGNYVLFFKLYKAAPNLHACLMDLYVEKMRFKAVQCISRSYRPTIPVTYVSRVLGFSSVVSTAEGNSDLSGGTSECIEWLKAHGAILTADKNEGMQLDTKASSSSLFMPEPEDAVPHGDANLAVNDFFTRTS